MLDTLRARLSSGAIGEDEARNDIAMLIKVRKQMMEWLKASKKSGEPGGVESLVTLRLVDVSVQDRDKWTYPYVCSTCSKRFSYKHHLNEHSLLHLAAMEERRPHQCTVCGFRVTKASNVAAHTRAVHNNERRFNCGICSFSAFRRTGLVQDVAEVHTPTTGPNTSSCSSNPRFSCSRCSYTSTRRWNVRRHERMMHQIP